jgi:hypothetical protein
VLISLLIYVTQSIGIKLDIYIYILFIEISYSTNCVSFLFKIKFLYTNGYFMINTNPTLFFSFLVSIYLFIYYVLIRPHLLFLKAQWECGFHQMEKMSSFLIIMPV